MTSKHTLAFMIGVASLACAATRPVSAHHSFPAEFDATKCSDTIGTLTKVDWQNPHAYFFVEVKDANGQVREVAFQLSSIANLTRGGSPRKMFIDNFGQTVMARGCAAKNGNKNRFAASYIKLPNGEIHRVGQDVEGVFGTREY